MRKIEGGRPIPITLGAEERGMLAEIMGEEMRQSQAEMVRVLIRREYLRRKAAKYEANYAEAVKA